MSKPAVTLIALLGFAAGLFAGVILAIASAGEPMDGPVVKDTLPATASFQDDSSEELTTVREELGQTRQQESELRAANTRLAKTSSSLAHRLQLLESTLESERVRSEQLTKRCTSESASRARLECILVEYARVRLFRYLTSPTVTQLQWVANNNIWQNGGGKRMSDAAFLRWLEFAEPGDLYDAGQEVLRRLDVADAREIAEKQRLAKETHDFEKYQRTNPDAWKNNGGVVPEVINIPLYEPLSTPPDGFFYAPDGQLVPMPHPVDRSEGAKELRQ